MATLYLRPNAAGDETNIPYQNPDSGAHWDKVDEVVSDEAATYVLWTESLWRRDLYNLENSGLSSAINWIKVWIRCRRDAELTFGLANTAIKTGGIVYEGESFNLTTSWADYSTQYTTNPQTGVAWTWADLNALQAGVSLYAPSTVIPYNSSCTQVYVEVNYPNVAPTVTTQAATNVLGTSCIGNGTITDTGGVNATRRGFCYKVGTSGDPTTADSVVYDDGSFGTGAYTKGITGLSPNTGYRVRAYAVNSEGTGYGATVQVTTLTAYIRLHTATTQRRYKAATFSTFVFPDPAGTGFTAVTDGYSMLAGWGLVGVFQMVLSGTLNITGSLGRKIRTSLSGSLTLTGTLNTVKRFLQTLYGTVNFSGSLSGKRVMILGGVLNLSGSLNRLIKKGLAATLNLTGALKGGLTFYKSLAGTLNLSGALATFQRFSKVLAGTLNLTGTLAKLVKKKIIGVLNSSGTLGRKIFKKLSGALNLSGAFSYAKGKAYKALAGTLNLSGSLGRKIRKRLVGTLSLSGILVSGFYKIRNLTVKVITKQYRDLRVVLKQYRIIKMVLKQYRKIKTFIFGGG